MSRIKVRMQIIINTTNRNTRNTTDNTMHTFSGSQPSVVFKQNREKPIEKKMQIDFKLLQVHNLV